MSDTKTLASGWGYPDRARLWHYFVGETSACGAWVWGWPRSKTAPFGRMCVKCMRAEQDEVEAKMAAGISEGCATCPEIEHVAQGECPKAERTCGHHCNCTWIHDQCCWCGATNCETCGAWPQDCECSTPEPSTTYQPLTDDPDDGRDAPLATPEDAT